jgi:hypothetical protein
MGHGLRRRSQTPGRPDGRVRPAAPMRGAEPPHRTGRKRSVPSVPLAHPHRTIHLRTAALAQRNTPWVGTEVGAGGAGPGPAVADALVEVCAGKSPGRSEPVVRGRPAARRGAHATCGPPASVSRCGGERGPGGRVTENARTVRRIDVPSHCGYRAPAQQPVACGDRTRHSALGRSSDLQSPTLGCPTPGSRADSVRAALSGRVTQDALTRR